MWFIIAANKGQKKTAALQLLKKPLLEIEAELQQDWQQDVADDKPSTPSELCIEHFSFEELHNVMRRNGSQVLGLFDEMSTLYGQLDLYRHSGSVMDQKTLITLNGGSSWSRNYRNYSVTLPKTAFNISGFIQPQFVEKVLMSDDADGFNGRQLFCFPPQRDAFLRDLKLPIPSDLPSLHDIYEHIRAIHMNTSFVYKFSEEALESFRTSHDDLVNRQGLQTNDNIQGILAKSRGYIARTSMLLFVLEQALTTVLNQQDLLHSPDPAQQSSPMPSRWLTTINSDAIAGGSQIVNYLCQQKFTMMDLKEVGPNDVRSDEFDDLGRDISSQLKRFLMMDVEKDGEIQ